MKFWKRKLISGWGVILLGIWLIATGLLPLLDLNVKWSSIVLSVLAIAAGTLLLLDR